MFLKLTRSGEKNPIYVNVNHIVEIEHYMVAGDQPYTILRLAGGSQLGVNETIAQIHSQAVNNGIGQILKP